MATPHHKNPTSNGKEVFLDTKGACFLCLKDPSTDTVLAGTTSGRDEMRVPLREVCSYLEINEFEAYGFAVALCDTCVIHVNQFVGLIHEMEEIQKRMARQLQQFHGILKESLESDQSKEQWEKISRKNPLTASLVGCLRKEAGQKCREKINTLGTKVGSDADVPVVIQGISTTHQTQSDASINPVEIEDLTSSNDITAESESHTSSVPKSSDNCRTRSKRTRSQLGTDRSCDKLESSKDTAMEIFNGNYSISGGGVGGSSQLDCLHCEFSVNGDSWKIRTHLVFDHPETLFPETKAPLLSDKVFTDCVKELFKSEVEIGRAEAKKRKISASMKSKSTLPQPLYCIQCDQTYANGRNYRYHLVVKHYDSLKKKLDRLQQNFSEGQTPIEIERTTPKGKKKDARGKKIFKCCVEEGGCGKTFRNQSNLARHKKTTCPKGEKEKCWGCRREDGGCGQLFLKKRMLKIHKLSSCPNKKLMRAENSGEEGRDDNVPKILHVSGSVIKSGSNLRRSRRSRGRSDNQEIEVMEEDPEALEGEGGEASGSGVTNVFGGSGVEDDNMFECEVFTVKSEL